MQPYFNLTRWFMQKEFWPTFFFRPTFFAPPTFFSPPNFFFRFNFFPWPNFFPQNQNFHHYNLNQTLHVLGFGIWDLGIGIEDLEFGIRDLGLGIEDLGHGILDLDTSWPTDLFDQFGVAQLSKILCLIFVSTIGTYLSKIDIWFYCIFKPP